MESFTIRDLELLTGIKSHTLRIWEQRYHFFKARRRQRTYRFYPNEDLKKLLTISFLYHNGWKASDISVLSDEELREAVRAAEQHTTNYASYVQKLLAAAIDFNEALFLEILNTLTEKIGLEKTIADVCYPYLRKVGAHWNTAAAIPAQEQFSNHIIQNRLIAETEKYATRQNGKPEIVLFCPENGQHELPLLYLNYLLRKNGWRVLYLGKNIKLSHLTEVEGVAGISYLYLHVTTSLTGHLVDDYFETLCKAFPGKTILASGKGIEGSQRMFVQVRLLKSDEEIHQFIQDRAYALGVT